MYTDVPYFKIHKINFKIRKLPTESLKKSNVSAKYIQSHILTFIQFTDIQTQN
jgi:hypothetical protein